MTNINTITEMIKTEFKGLKRLIELCPEYFIVGTEHPFNPIVTVRPDAVPYFKDLSFIVSSLVVSIICYYVSIQIHINYFFFCVISLLYMEQSRILLHPLVRPHRGEKQIQAISQVLTVGEKKVSPIFPLILGRPCQPVYQDKGVRYRGSTCTCNNNNGSSNNNNNIMMIIHSME